MRLTYTNNGHLFNAVGLSHGGCVDRMRVLAGRKRYGLLRCKQEHCKKMVLNANSDGSMFTMQHESKEKGEVMSIYIVSSEIRCRL